MLTEKRNAYTLLIMKTQPNLRKGDKALWVGVGARDGVCSFWVRPIQITSWGKRQGTAIEVVNGKNITRRLYTGEVCEYGFQSVFCTMEDVKLFIAECGLQIAVRSIEGSLNCEESNFNHLLPKYRPAAQARIDKLKTTVPIFDIIERQL